MKSEFLEVPLTKTLLAQERTYQRRALPITTHNHKSDAYAGLVVADNA